MSDIIVSIRDLGVHYPLGRRLLGQPPILRAVAGVSLDIPRGAIFGLVGESGSGKTSLGRASLGAAPISQGQVTLAAKDGEVFDVATLDRGAQKRFRRSAQLIFQDPYAALSPRMTVRDIIAEPLEVMKLCPSREAVNARVREIAAQCRLNLEHLRRFPHAFSGGQRQRISIARALVTLPEYIVADESVAALDVSIQADILNLLLQLRHDLGLTILFISHDLRVVAHVCDQVAVMYLGRIVEVAPPRRLFAAPRHPYTRALISAIPSLDPDARGAPPDRLEGEIPSPVTPPPGCSFHTRCPVARPRCRVEAPILRPMAAGHSAACHFAEELAPPPPPNTPRLRVIT
ncbi:MAG: ATP-binding cassette domain-containing protein [Proteobacteria bacterium]|nr:ATP-binding cassette domain-containing protein [Pseudomonadota bacterium]